MNLVISSNNNNLALKVLSASDSLVDFYEKTQYNFDQILLYGGGKKGDPGDKGDKGVIGATGIGLKGDTGIRGTKIFYSQSSIINGSPALESYLLNGDTVIDSNGTYFEVITDSFNNLIYSQQFNLAFVSSSQYWNNQYNYQNLSIIPVTQWVLHNGGSSGNEKNLVVAKRSNIDPTNDKSEFYRLLIGIDSYPGVFNSSVFIANILPDSLTTANTLSDARQIGLKHRLNSTVNCSANTLWMGYVEQSTQNRMIGVFENLSTKLYLVHDTVNSSNSYLAIRSGAFVLFNETDLDSMGSISYPYEIKYVASDHIRERFHKLKTTEANTYIDSYWNIIVNETYINGTLKTQKLKTNFDLDLVSINANNGFGSSIGVKELSTTGVLDLTNQKTSIIQVVPNHSNNYNIVTDIIGVEHLQYFTLLFGEPIIIRTDAITIANTSISISGFYGKSKYDFDAGDTISFLYIDYSIITSGINLDKIFIAHNLSFDRHRPIPFLLSDISGDYDNMIPGNGYITGYYYQKDIASGLPSNAPPSLPIPSLPYGFGFMEIIEAPDLSSGLNISVIGCIQKYHYYSFNGNVEAWERKIYQNTLGVWIYTPWQRPAYLSLPNSFGQKNTFNGGIEVSGSAYIDAIKIKRTSIQLFGNGSLTLNDSTSHLYIDCNSFAVGSVFDFIMDTPTGTTQEGRILYVIIKFPSVATGHVRFVTSGGSPVPFGNIDYKGSVDYITSSAAFFGEFVILHMFYSNSAVGWLPIWTTNIDPINTGRFKGTSNNW